MSKKSKIIILIIAIVIIVGVSIGLGVYSNQCSQKNQQVNAIATECENEINAVALGTLAQPIDKNKAYANVVELSIVMNTKVNENALTYADGSKNKYNEVVDTGVNALEEYKNFFNGQNEKIFNESNIDVNAATKEELTAAYNTLTGLSQELEKTLNSTIWSENKEWSMLWGDNEDEAKTNYSDFKKKVDDKAVEIKNRLDAINAQEAQAAQQQAQSNATASGSAGTSGNGYSGGGSSSGGGGGYTPHGPTMAEAEAAYQQYVAYWRSRGQEPTMSHDEFIRRYMYGG